MTTFGTSCSSEQFGPSELVDQARRAEAAGFDALWISDHFHPWNDEQGQSPFVWGVIGALSEATSLPVSTAVTCPTVRIHRRSTEGCSPTVGQRAAARPAGADPAPSHGLRRSDDPGACREGRRCHHLRIRSGPARHATPLLRRGRSGRGLRAADRSGPGWFFAATSRRCCRSSAGCTRAAGLTAGAGG